MGSSLVGYGAVSLWAGGTGLLPLSVGAAALLAAEYGCSWDPNAPDTNPGPLPLGDTCWKTTGTFAIDQWANGGKEFQLFGGINEIVHITKNRVENGVTVYKIGVRVPGSSTVYEGDGREGTSTVDGSVLSLEISGFTGTCETPGPGGGGGPPPYAYNDPDTGCELTVNFEGIGVTPDGKADFVLKIEPAAQARASGGVIGGCNFAPTLYFGDGGGGGPIRLPWVDPGPGPDGDPWWKDALEEALGGVARAVVERALEEIFGDKAPAEVYRLVSVCETDAQGEAISQSREVAIPQLPILQGIVARLDAMDDLMQGLKDFKQPVCKGPRPQGELVTARFRSTAPSPNSARVLRKELRYRDNAGRSEAEHVAHWLPFEWRSGPAIVTSRGAAWGIVQVWAADPAEGRRVIEHAAAIAGVDLTVQNHIWEDATARDSRYGQPGLMKVEHDHEGDPCVSKRIGPSGTPGWMRDP